MYTAHHQIKDVLENKNIERDRHEELLVFIADVVPIVPSAVSHDIVEVGVGEDDAGVLAHCTAHIEWSGSGDPAVEECEPGFLVGHVSVLGRYRPESCCY